MGTSASSGEGVGEVVGLGTGTGQVSRRSAPYPPRWILVFQDRLASRIGPLFGGPWECPLDLERPLDLDLEGLLERALLCE
ncbi:hypothetical protein MTO96_042502 [Rhipicephalus appendiculatus]